MSYQVRNSLRLNGRDIQFAALFWKQKFLDYIYSRKNEQVILCNSYPKSGTHLLYQVLYSIPQLNQWDDIVSVQSLSGVMNTPSHIRWKIGSAPRESIIRSHLIYCDDILNILRESKCKIFFIYRDLRDVAVSHARWVTNENRIFLHQLYKNAPSFDEQLMYSIKGIPLGTPLGSNISQPDIGTDFSRWKDWINDKDTFSIRFEDLVGERGGGDESKRLQLVREILDFLCINLSPEEIERKFSSYSMNPNESHTFKKGGRGSIGGWRTKYQEIHKDAFKNVAGQTLIDLGYEEDFSW